MPSIDKKREVLAQLEKAENLIRYAIAQANDEGLTVTTLEVVLTDLSAEIEVQKAAVAA